MPATASSTFSSTVRPERTDVEEEADQAVKELLHEHGADLPQLTSLGERRDQPGRVA